MREQIARFILGVAANERAKTRRQWLGQIRRIASFLWRHKLALVLVIIVFFAAAGLKGCAPQFGKSRDAIQLEARLAKAEAEMQVVVNARDAMIAQAASEAAVHRAQITLLLEQGHRDIEAATPVDERPIDAGLEAAWRLALERLRLYPAGDAAGAHSGGASA